MRLPYFLFTASVVVLWKASRSTTARVNETDGPALANQTEDPAHKLFTFSSLQEASASVVSGPSELYDASVNATNYVHQNDEERVWTLTSFLSEAFCALRTQGWLLLQKYPDDAFWYMTQLVSGDSIPNKLITHWLEYLTSTKLKSVIAITR